MFFKRKPKFSAQELAQIRYRTEIDLSQIPGARPVQQGIVDIACTTQFGTLSYRVILPPAFPDQPPDMRLLVQATHPWVNKALQIVAHPALIKWRPECDLVGVCRAIQSEFVRNPPKPVAQPVGVPIPRQSVPPVQSSQPAVPQPLHLMPAGAGYPGSSPRQVSPLPGRSPATSVDHRPASEMPPAYDEKQDAGREHAASVSDAGGSVRRTEKPAIPDSFPKLDAYSTRQLEGMLDDSYKLREFVETIEAVQTMNSMRDDLYKKVENLANQNLDHKANVQAQLQEVASLRSELAAKQLHLRDITTRQQQIQSAFSTPQLIKAFEEALEKTEEDSDLLQRRFFDEEIDLNEFAKEYLNLRIQYHDRAARKERLSELSGR